MAHVLNLFSIFALVPFLKVLRADEARAHVHGMRESLGGLWNAPGHSVRQSRSLMPLMFSTSFFQHYTAR